MSTDSNASSRNETGISPGERCSLPEKAGPASTRAGFTICILVLCILLYAALRMRWIGHLLVWDEAMSLCTIRSLLSHGTDAFSNWFWKHPPLFSLLTTLLQPFKAGFAERVELMSVAIGALNLALLFILNRKVFGTKTALWTIFFLAVLPGSIFFDVWIKTDHTVTTFGLLALILLFSGKSLYAGVSLGLAMLSKETAVFYCSAAFLLWASGATGRRTLTDFFALTVIPLLTCGWWYWGVKLCIAGNPTTGLSGSLAGLLFGGFSENIKFAMGTQTGFDNVWYYYFQKLPLQIGLMGIMFSIVAFVLLGRVLILGTSDKKETSGRTSHLRLLWPVFVIIPAYLVLSSITSKVPWTVISILPAWATLQGLGFSKLLSMVTASSPGNETRPSRRTIMAASAALIVIAALLNAYRSDYETTLKATAPGQWRGAHYSRDIACKMNSLAKDDERILLTSFHYWKGLGPAHPCPLFACYFTRKSEVLLRHYDRSFPELLGDIRKYRLDWALLSPEPGRAEREIINGFSGKYGLTPCMMEKAMIFRTTPLYMEKELNPGGNTNPVTPGQSVP